MRKNRNIANIVFTSLTYLAGLFSLGILVFLLSLITYKGISSLSFDFLTSKSRNFGASGGILYQILGSLLLVIVAGLLSFPVALGAAIYKSEFLSGKRARKISDLLLFALNGVPSVVFGIFGLVVFVNLLNTGISWFVGSIILGVMILPTIVLSAYNELQGIPQSHRESAEALGMSHWRMIVTVLLKPGLRGARTGLLIGLARAIGETAPIMFIATAFSGVTFPGSLLEPVSSLPTHILALAQQASNEQALENSWGASFILLCLVVLFSLTAFATRIKIRNIRTNTSFIRQ